MKIIIPAIALLASVAPSPVHGAFSSYADRMGGTAVAPPKPASFAPGGGKHFAPVKGSGMISYLDQVAPPRPPVAAAVAPPPRAPPAPAAPAADVSSAPATTAVSAGDYLSSLKVASPVSGAGFTSYLDAVGTTGSPPTGGGQLGYLDVVGGGRRSVAKPATYGIGGGKPTFVPKAASAAAATTPVSSSGNNDVLAAISNMTNQMNSNQKATITVLKDISAGVKLLVSKAEAKAAAATGATAGNWQ